MKKLLTIFAIFFCAACSSQEPTSTLLTPDEETEVSYIETDDEAQDVDNLDTETEKNARMASTSETIYFQVQSDDGNKYVKTYKLEDYYFGSLTLPLILDDLTPVNRKGATYALIKTAGVQYIKSKSLKSGLHVIVLNNNAAYGVVTVVKGAKQLINFDLSGGASTNMLLDTRLIRVSADAAIPQQNGMFKVYGLKGSGGETFSNFVLRNEESADQCEGYANWFFDAELNAGKSVAVRMMANGTTSKILLWTKKGDTPIGRSIDLTAKKGIALKFKQKKKGY